MDTRLLLIEISLRLASIIEAIDAAMDNPEVDV